MEEYTEDISLTKTKIQWHKFGRYRNILLLQDSDQTKAKLFSTQEAKFNIYNVVEKRSKIVIASG